jgi:hypothetical protein
MEEKNKISREETVATAKQILRDALLWIDGGCEKPQANNLDAVALVARALQDCGI